MAKAKKQNSNSRRDVMIAAESIRSLLYSATENLDDQEYLEVLELIAGDCEAMIEAKKMEIGEK